MVYDRRNGIQTGDRETENQAHRFAGAFLFPRTAVLREFPRSERINWIALLSLKRRWKMSLAAIIWRGYDLKILSPVQHRIANIHLSKSGQKKVEKLDQDEAFPVESPELLSSVYGVLDTYLSGGIVTLGGRLGLRPEILRLITGMEVASEPTKAENVVRLFP